MIRLLIPLVIFLTSIHLMGKPNQLASQGSIDISSWNAHEKPQLLTGEWLVFWNEYLTPVEALERVASQRGLQYANIPSSFSEMPIPGVETMGYATYLLRVKGIPENSSLAVGSYSAYTASQLYFFTPDDAPVTKPLITIGQFGTNSEQSLPKIDSQKAVEFRTSADDYYLMIHVSNFHHSWGGIWVPPLLANPEYLQKLSRGKNFNYLIFGVLLILAVFNLSLWMQRHEDKASFYLSLFCLLMAARFCTYSELIYDFTTLLPEKIAFMIQWKGIYLANCFAIPLTLSFLNSNFPGFINARIKKAMWYIGSLMCAVMLIDMIFYGTYILLLSKIFVLVGSCFSIYICVLIASKKVLGSKFIVVGGFFLLIGVFYDVMNSFGIEQPFDVLSLGLVMFLFMQSQIVGVRFAKTFREVERLNQSLQDEVDRQTRDIKMIMKHIKQGIFTIDDDMQITGDHSEYLKNIFEFQEISGQSLDHLIFANSNLSENKINEVKSTLISSFGEPSFCFEANCDLLPNSIDYKAPTTNEIKYLELDWVPIVNKQDIIDKVLVTSRDVTILRQLEEQSRTQNEEMQIMVEVISMSAEKFDNFITQSQGFIQRNRELIQLSKTPNSDILKMLFINLHTMKGLARTFRLKAIAEISHNVEQRYAAIQKEEEQWDPETLLSDLDLLGKNVNRYVEINDEKLGRGKESDLIRLKRGDVERWMQELSLDSVKSNNSLLELYTQLFNECFISLSTVMEDLVEHTRVLAKDLNKLKPKIKFGGDNVRFSRNGSELLRNIMVHLIRNSMDHGIEQADQRLQKGKPAEGRISISLKNEGDFVRLVYSDDGAGLNLPIIRELAIQRGLIAENDEVSAQELSDVIFQSGFSTAVNVNQISGRGVGMDAVRQYLNDEGGDITLEFKEKPKGLECVPFVLNIKIPNLFFKVTLLAA